MSLDVSLYVPEIEAKPNRVVFAYNITHNLGRMASEARVYQALWRPDEQGWTRAKDITEELRSGLRELTLWPEKYKAFNPENGWGSYEGLVQFVQAYLEACQIFPDAEIYVSR